MSQFAKHPARLPIISYLSYANFNALRWQIDLGSDKVRKVVELFIYIYGFGAVGAMEL